MRIIKKAKEAIASGTFQELCIDFLSDTFALLGGDWTAAARIMYSAITSALSLREHLFWNKFECFLTEVEVDDDFHANFCKVLAEENDDGDNAARIVDTIDKIDTVKKAKYLANASRCVAAGFIDVTTYFRICHSLKSALQEDLLFLQKSIMEQEEYEYSDTVQGLINCGLMYQSVFDSNGNDRYAFTPFAGLMDRYAVSYDDVNRYPMCGSDAPQVPQHLTKLIARYG